MAARNSKRSISTMLRRSKGTGNSLRWDIRYGRWLDFIHFLFKVVTCTPLVTPPHAVKQIAPCPNTYGSSCTFSCQTGYTSSKGNVTRTCLASGKWSGSDINCTGIQTSSPLLSLRKTKKYGTTSLKHRDGYSWGPYNYYLCHTDDKIYY